MRHTMEVIHYRSSDDGCDLIVLVDGERVPFTEYNIDSGRGWTLAEWNETTEYDCAHASPQAEVIIREMRDSEVEHSPYIEDKEGV